jgi:hypothetical protein
LNADKVAFGRVKFAQQYFPISLRLVAWEAATMRVQKDTSRRRSYSQSIKLHEFYCALAPL